MTFDDKLQKFIETEDCKPKQIGKSLEDSEYNCETCTNKECKFYKEYNEVEND